MATLVRLLDVIRQVCAECICLPPAWGHEGGSYNVTMGVFLFEVLHHLEQSVPAYSAETATVRVA